MKKLFCLILVLIFCAGCGGEVEKEKNENENPAQKVEQSKPTPQPPAPPKVATLHTTPTTFQQRYNQIMSAEMGAIGASGTLNIGAPQIQSGSAQDVVQYIFGESAILTETVDKNTGEIKEIMVTAVLSQDSEIFRANLMNAFVIYIASMKATNPNLNDTQNIQEQLGLLDPNKLFKDMSTSYGGIKYSKKSVSQIGMVFTISAE